MPSNSKNIAELLNTDTTIAVTDVADGSITTAKLAADAVTAAKLASSAVTTAKIAADAVTNAKVADDAVQIENVASGLNLGRRNLFINGDMQISQKPNAGSLAMAHDGNTSSVLVDRFRMSLGGTHEQLDGTQAQVAEHPLSNGLAKSLKWTTGTPETSYDADEYVYFTQIIEARNAQHLNWGTSNAKSITLSFYVKSSITGTFAVGIYKDDNTARIYNKTYTISSANTWEKKIVTFAGDTAGGGINNDNGRGFYMSWHLGAGSGAVGGGSNGAWKSYSGLSDWADGHGTNAVMTTSGATWQMTMCQLEVGDNATDFEHRSFAEELALCQRYYQEYISYKLYFNGANEPSSEIGNSRLLPVVMRALPTVANKTSTHGSAGAFSANTHSIRYLTVSSHGSGGFNVGFDLDSEM